MDVSAKLPDFDGEGIPLLPAIPYPTLTAFIGDNSATVSRYVYKKLNEAISNDLIEIVLFRIKDTKMEIFIEKQNYEEILRSIKDRFLKLEEYEMIPRCNRLLDKFHVNKVIDESR